MVQRLFCKNIEIRLIRWQNCPQRGCKPYSGGFDGQLLEQCPIFRALFVSLEITLAEQAMEALREILHRARTGLKGGWLFLPKAEHWYLDTQGIIIDTTELPESEVDEDGYTTFAKDNALLMTLETAMIEDIVSYAGTIEPVPSDELLLESFIYYYEHDAFLPSPGYQPPSREDAMLKMDRDFYNLLGAERADVQCRHQSCLCGAIKGSVFCRSHHFEMIQKKPCPFSD